MAPALGSLLGRYEIKSPLGAGGMDEVYLAQDTQLRRPVALKILPEDFTRDADRLRRFQQEACAASALNHRISIRFTRSARRKASTSLP